MADEPGTTPIQRVYAQRIAADLEHNRAEQQKVGEQLARLQARLEQLRADEEWLSGLRQGTAAAATAHLGADGGTAEETATGEAAGVGPAPAEETAVPQQRQEGPADEAPAAQKAAKAGGRKPARRTAAKKPAAKKAASGRKSAGPSLRELTRECLERQGGPRSAAEITGELRAARPERTLTVQVVRNALEKLVATGTAERSKQGAHVFYFPVAAPSAAAAPGTEETEAVRQAAEPAAAGA